VLFHRVRYQLSYRDVAEIFLLRGFDFTHETVRDWEERFAPIFADQLRAKRKGKAGHKWYVDETVRHEARYRHGVQTPAAGRRAASLSP
jgi:transposase-like protein